MIRICEQRKHLNRINEARDIETLTFDELTDEQQEEVAEKISGGYNSFYDVLYPIYIDEVMRDIDEYEWNKAKEVESECDLTIHPDKLDWQAYHSQNPYPEWGLSKVFDSICNDTYLLRFYGDGLDVCAEVMLFCKNSKYNKVYDCKFDSIDNDLQDLQYIDKSVYNEVVEYVSAAQDYIDCVWRKIESVCSPLCPDVDWIKDFLLANSDDFEFYTDENGDIRLN